MLLTEIEGQKPAKQGKTMSSLTGRLFVVALDQLLSRQLESHRRNVGGQSKLSLSVLSSISRLSTD